MTEVILLESTLILACGECGCPSPRVNTGFKYISGQKAVQFQIECPTCGHTGPWAPAMSMAYYKWYNPETEVTR